MNILDDLPLFGKLFEGESWRPWKAFLAAQFGLPMDEAALEIFRRHTARVTPPSEPFSETALVVGRRGGKSQILALLGVYLAAFKDYTPYLSPGEVATVAIIAASRQQARTIFRYCRGLLDEIPELAAMIVDDKNDIITLNNRVAIEIHTASFRVTRGYSFCAVLADECAYWRTDDTSANPDIEIMRAIRPAMGTIPGSVLMIASSPYRRSGVLWTAFKENYGRDDADVLVWKASTLEMHPSFPRKIVDKAYADDPSAAAAEYGAEFRIDIDVFVGVEVVDAVTEFGCYERPPATRSQRLAYTGFVDAAGGSGQDSMTMAIAHKDGELAVLDALRERKPRFSPDDVVNEFAGLLKSYGIKEATADRWGGDFVVEAFKKQGITVKHADMPKSDLYRELLPMLNAGRCSLIENATLSKQLVSLERRVARGGKDSIDHPQGGKDDVANAAAGALVLCKNKRIMCWQVPEIHERMMAELGDNSAGTMRYRRLGY